MSPSPPRTLCRPARRFAIALGCLALAHAPRASHADELILSNVPAWIGPVESSRSIALADIDGDGRLDLVRGNFLGPSSLYLNREGTFPDAASARIREERTRSIALGDVDGDGRMDLVRGNEGRGATLYLNAGDGFASDTAWTGPPDFTSDVALADLDGDGRLDLVCANGDLGTTIYLNAGSRFVRSPVQVGERENTSGVALGDVDGDGRVDLVRGNVGQGTTLYLNHGGASILDSVAAWTGPVQDTYVVALADVDGDGALDLVCGNLGQGATLHLNRGGVFDPSPAWIGPDDVTSLALGDADGDGDLDLACGRRGEGVRVYLNVGGTFDTIPVWTGPAESTASLAFGDVDGDGDLDLVSGNDGQATTLYRNLSGAFVSAPSWSAAAEHTTSVALGDMDGDDRLDLVCGNAGEPARVYLNSGDSLTATAWSAPAENTFAIALGDVDGDGRLDLVRGNVQSAITVYKNTGNAFDPTPLSVGSPMRTSSVALGDVDGNGTLDLVRGDQGQPVQPTVLYLNRGAGAFDSTWSGPPENTQGVALADVDGDGRLDLVRGNAEPWETTFYRNVGGRFDSTAGWRGPPENTTSVALGDIDGDGRPDLVRGNSGQATLYPNIGEAFASTSVWAGPVEETQTVALGDVDGDGRVDLVRGNGGATLRRGATLSLNTGGTFALTPAWTGPEEHTRSVALGDVNGDGVLDLVRGNNGEPTTLYLHRSPWIVPTVGGLARNQLPNDPAYLKWVRVAPSAPNQYRVSFQAFDIDSDPLWLVGEYQFEGSANWRPMILGGATLRSGPFSTAPTGVPHQIVWDFSTIPFDRREVVIRLRALSPPRHAGIVQFLPSYLAKVGRVSPIRPALAAAPERLSFPTLTVGDTATATLHLSNPGTADLVVNGIDSPDPAIAVRAEPTFVVPAGGERFLDVVLAPLRRVSDLAPLRILSDDPFRPVVEIPIVSDVRALEVDVRVLAVPDTLPLGEPATVLVTPAPQVHVQSGRLHYRARGAAAAFEDVPLVAQGSSFSAQIPGDRVTEAGVEFFVRVQNGAASSSRPPGAPDSTLFRPVGPPAGITAVALADTADQYPAGRDTPVEVTLPRGSQFQSGTLYYRRSGAAAYDSLELAAVADTPELVAGVIPGGAVGPRGLEYWVRVHTLTAALSWPAAPDPSARPTAVRTRISGLGEDRTHAGGRYRMVSVPLDLGLPSTASLEAVLADQPEFLAYDVTRWRSFRYVPQREGYVEISEEAKAAGMLRPEPGRAFWLIARDPNRIDIFPLTGLSTPSRSPFRLAVQHGWNQIGNPFAFTVAWRDVRFEGPTAPATLKPPVVWNEDQAAYTDAATLEPFGGYWVFNPSADPLDLLIPPLESAEARVEGAREPSQSLAGGERRPYTDSWRVQITASCAGHSDAWNVAGVERDALEGEDALDRPDPPPPPGPGLSLYFVADGAPDVRRTADIRPPIPSLGDPATRGHGWIFDVARVSDGLEPREARLDFGGVDQLPADLEVRLVDRRLGQSLDVRRERSHTFIASRRDFVTEPSEARFELLAGTPAFVEAAQRDAVHGPLATRLLPVVPNPLVTAGLIRFETARPGRVTLGVFDLSGRRVRALVDGNLDAGRHEILWQGSGDRATRLAPGLYVLRLVGPDRTDTHKLALLH